MIRINLLPHREMRRERRKKDFVGLGVLTAIVAGAIAFVVGVYNANEVSGSMTVYEVSNLTAISAVLPR